MITDQAPLKEYLKESMKPLPQDAYDTWHKVYDDMLSWCRNPNTATEVANKALMGWLVSNGVANNVINPTAPE